MEKDIQAPLDIYLGQSLGGLTGLIVKQNAWADVEWVEGRLLMVLDKPEIKRIFEKNPFMPVVVTSADQYGFRPSEIYNKVGQKIMLIGEVSTPPSNIWHYKAINHVVDLDTVHDEQRYDYPWNMLSFIIGQNVETIPIIPWSLLMYVRRDPVCRLVSIGLSDKAIMHYILNNPGWSIISRLKARSANFAGVQQA